MMQCKIEFTYASHCVSKNVTPRRMLKKNFPMFLLNGDIIAFRIFMTLSCFLKIRSHSGSNLSWDALSLLRHFQQLVHVSCYWIVRTKMWFPFVFQLTLPKNVLCSKLIFSGCCNRWLPYLAMFIVNSISRFWVVFGYEFFNLLFKQALNRP